MLSQNELKYFTNLKQKKFRQKEKKFLVEGYRLVKEALDSKYKCEILICNKSFVDKNNSLFAILQKRTRTEIISDAKFQKLSETKSPQGIVAVLSMYNAYAKIKDSEGLIVALENISDPGNVGTIIRTCDWFGVRSVIVSPGSVDLFNSKVIRSTMGSLFHVNVYEAENFYSELDMLKNNGWEILCSDMDGDNIFSRKENKKVILILSNEAHGPTDEVLNLTDRIITIPKYGKAESLNVASAAAIMIAELRNLC
ncbi:MAG: RNA methyltransferase [Bacteroidota bacterium]